MPRPLTLVISAACVGVTVLLVVLLLKKDRRPAASESDEPAPLVEHASSESRVVDQKPGPRAPAAAARPAAQAPVHPDARKPSDEETLARLHELAGSDPALSLKIARDAVNRFPDSPNAPEFEWNVVKALFNQSRLEEAEAEARIMLSRYPDSDFTGDVVHHLLNHPPNPSDAQ
jgi:hypothetical protein